MPASEARPTLRVLAQKHPAATTATGDTQLATLVRAAASGHPDAWDTLVRRFDRPLRRVAAAYRLDAADVDDALQNTWVRFFDNATRIRQPEAVQAWLTTTTRRECLRILQNGTRELPSPDPNLGDRPDPWSPEAAALAAEQRSIMHRAIRELPERHRQLVTLLFADEDPSYSTISRVLAMPVGSIGPIRARCLHRLGRSEEAQALREALAAH